MLHDNDFFNDLFIFFSLHRYANNQQDIIQLLWVVEYEVE